MCPAAYSDQSTLVSSSVLTINCARLAAFSGRTSVLVGAAFVQSTYLSSTPPPRDDSSSPPPTTRSTITTKAVDEDKEVLADERPQVASLAPPASLLLQDFDVDSGRTTTTNETAFLDLRSPTSEDIAPGGGDFQIQWISSSTTSGDQVVEGEGQDAAAAFGAQLAAETEPQPQDVSCLSLPSNRTRTKSKSSTGAASSTTTLRYSSSSNSGGSAASSGRSGRPSTTVLVLAGEADAAGASASSTQASTVVFPSRPFLSEMLAAEGSSCTGKSYDAPHLFDRATTPGGDSESSRVSKLQQNSNRFCSDGVASEEFSPSPSRLDPQTFGSAESGSSSTGRHGGDERQFLWDAIDLDNPDVRTSTPSPATKSDNDVPEHRNDWRIKALPSGGRCSSTDSKKPSKFARSRTGTTNLHERIKRTKADLVAFERSIPSLKHSPKAQPLQFMALDKKEKTSKMEAPSASKLSKRRLKLHQGEASIEVNEEGLRREKVKDFLLRAEAIMASDIAHADDHGFSGAATDMIIRDGDRHDHTHTLPSQRDRTSPRSSFLENNSDAAYLPVSLFSEDEEPFQIKQQTPSHKEKERLSFILPKTSCSKGASSSTSPPRAADDEKRTSACRKRDHQHQAGVAVGTEKGKNMTRQSSGGSSETSAASAASFSSSCTDRNASHRKKLFHELKRDFFKIKELRAEQRYYRNSCREAEEPVVMSGFHEQLLSTPLQWPLFFPASSSSSYTSTSNDEALFEDCSSATGSEKDSPSAPAISNMGADSPWSASSAEEAPWIPPAGPGLADMFRCVKLPGRRRPGALPFRGRQGNGDDGTSSASATRLAHSLSTKLSL
ncbi:unnamed protein product [Amoebophrya sp. A120]|nr:unnamed protein product [Amoebophrya sp. A120]|eukprot:GSA120T00022028001.1